MHVDNLNPTTLILADHEKRMWLARNRGVFVQVARQLKVSRQAVSKVWRGEMRSKRIERAFRRRLAPGFESRKVAA